MSGAQLCHLLENELGFRTKDRKKLDPASFDWMFVSDDANRPMLHWLCSSVSKKNIITREELKRFEEMTDEGTVLTGKDLEDALRAVRTETDVSDIDDLQAEIAALEEEYNVAKSDLRDVVRQRDHMQAQLSNAQTKNKAIQQLAQKRTDQFHRTISQKLAQRNAQMNDVLKGLSSVSTEFVQQHVADSTGSLFLSTAPLNEYYEQDDVYTSHVRRYMKQYLGSATGEAVADDNDAILNDPSLQFIRGIDAETHAKNCQEMNRLQNAFVSYFYAIFQAQMTNDTITASYAASELDKIQADLLLVRTKAAYDTVKLQLLREQQYYAIDAATLKHKISEAKSGITKSKQSLKRQLDTAVAETLSELAQLQSTTILWGDYNLKIARQHYKIFKQQKAITYLMQQQARHNFLSLMLNKESREIYSHFQILSCIVLELEQLQKQTQLRAAKYAYAAENSVHRPKASTNGANELMDPSLASLARLLSSPTHALPQAISVSQSSSDSIIGALTALVQRHDEVTQQLKQERQKVESELESLRALAAKFRKILSESSTGSSLRTPVLTPRMISEANQKLEASISSLTAEMESLIRDHNAKARKIQEMSREQLLERSLFVYFYTDPKTLVRLERDLQLRVDAKVVK